MIKQLSSFVKDKITNQNHKLYHYSFIDNLLNELNIIRDVIRFSKYIDAAKNTDDPLS